MSDIIPPCPNCVLLAELLAAASDRACFWQSEYYHLKKLKAGRGKSEAERDKIIIDMRFTDDLTYGQIAKRLRESYHTIARVCAAEKKRRLAVEAAERDLAEVKKLLNK